MSSKLNPNAPSFTPGSRTAASSSSQVKSAWSAPAKTAETAAPSKPQEDARPQAAHQVAPLSEITNKRPPAPAQKPAWGAPAKAPETPHEPTATPQVPPVAKKAQAPPPGIQPTFHTPEQNESKTVPPVQPPTFVQPITQPSSDLVMKKPPAPGRELPTFQPDTSKAPYLTSNNNVAPPSSKVITPATYHADLKGKLGTPLNVIVNYFRMSVNVPNIYQYDIKYEPHTENQCLRHSLLNAHKAEIGPFILDGDVLFLQQSIGDITLHSKCRINDKEYALHISMTGEISKKKDTVFQLYNILFRKQMRHLGLQPVGRNYFDPKRRTSYPDFKFEVWPGYQTACVLSEGGIQLNAGLCFKVLRTDSCLNFIANFRGNKDQIREALVGQVVLTRHNNKTYRVEAVDFTKNPLTTFQAKCKDKSKGALEEVSFRDFYLNVHNLKLYDLQQPLLAIRQKTKNPDDNDKSEDSLIYLPPEVCTMTGITDEMRTNFKLMQELHKVTRVEPKVRIAELQNFIGDFAAPRDQKVQSDLTVWPMKIEPAMIQTRGRTLPTEDLVFKANRSVKAGDRADWSSCFKDGKFNFVAPANLSNWVVIYSKRDAALASELIKTLKQVGEPLGLAFSKAPQEITLNYDNGRDYESAIHSGVTNQTQLVVCLLPNNRPDRYEMIKTALCTKNPVPSQCIVARTLNDRKKFISVVTKIVQQMNVKVGGQLWHLNKIPFPGPVMLVGVDVFHSGFGSNAKSVAGFCATTDRNFVSYYSRVCFNKPGQELTDELSQCLRSALRKFFDVNKVLPAYIILYRDGVGEGQLAAVNDYEIPQFRKAFADLPNYSPKFTVVIVKKRINTRLFAASGGNPPPGTIVDTEITKPVSAHQSKTNKEYDFFLVSQFGGQGTVQPTHYHVLLDESGLPVDHIQQLTYRLCHLYYNWPGTIRVPSPCQYSHKLAYLIGQSVRTEHHEALASKLFYL